MNSIIPELAKIFKVFNREFFDGSISTPKFGIESKRKHLFRYDVQLDTFFVGSEAAEVGVADLQSAFLHEMVHVYNAQNGIADLTTNQYHNKYFLEMALQVGLICIRHKNQGWSITTIVWPRNVVDTSSIRKPEDEAMQHRQEVFRENRPRQSALRTFRSKIRQTKNKSAKTYFLKYVCGCMPPHNSIRSGRRPDGANPLRIKCRDCGEDFVCEV